MLFIPNPSTKHRWSLGPRTVLYAQPLPFLTISWRKTTFNKQVPVSVSGIQNFQTLKGFQVFFTKFRIGNCVATLLHESFSEVRLSGPPPIYLLWLTRATSSVLEEWRRRFWPGKRCYIKKNSSSCTSSTSSISSRKRRKKKYCSYTLLCFTNSK